HRPEALSSSALACTGSPELSAPVRRLENHYCARGAADAPRGDPIEADLRQRAKAHAVTLSRNRRQLLYDIPRQLRSVGDAVESTGLATVRSPGVRVPERRLPGPGLEC